MTNKFCQKCRWGQTESTALVGTTGALGNVERCFLIIDRLLDKKDHPNTTTNIDNPEFIVPYGCPFSLEIALEFQPNVK